jgi:prevent-host-death family protein
MRREQLENMVSITELANKASQIVSKAQAGKTQIVMRHNKPAAVLMDVELYLAIAELSNVWHKDLDEGEWADIIDYAETVVTVRRADANDDGTRYTFDELLESVGLTREDLK